ncbi:MAG: leucyl/phenylalanyl-tRNA--protein transferase [Nitrospirae bacterium]|nr:MAG: leucyl/phenylalanyl-tRNA--protein transferase [Nitrospirota bacterium]
MPIFELRSDDTAFPPPELAEPEGLLAIGGDLSPRRLLKAYRVGIFPWFSEGDPYLWWSPDPRLVLYPEELHVSRSLRQTIKKGIFEITSDRAFPLVIEMASQVHRAKDGSTWITADMITAYTELHRMGYAHSIEAWKDGELAGGLYGVSLGRAFFGESMFTRVSNASKVAFVKLVQYLRKRDFSFIDCQVSTRHLKSLGAREIPRSRFLAELKDALMYPTLKGPWRIE